MNHAEGAETNAEDAEEGVLRVLSPFLRVTRQMRQIIPDPEKELAYRGTELDRGR
jgi:hypothetical protein